VLLAFASACTPVRRWPTGCQDRAPLTAPESMGTLELVVVDRWRGEPEAAPDVVAILVGGTTKLEGRTDRCGVVVFSAVPPGSYHLELLTPDWSFTRHLEIPAGRVSTVYSAVNSAAHGWESTRVR
jgi:hypothetical protein